MLRIHFTFDDLRHTKIVTRPDPMWEIVLGAQLLQNREGATVFRSWRRHAKSRLGEWAHIVTTLAPHAKYFPDFLTPAAGTSSVEEGIDTLLATPRRRLNEELGILGAQNGLPGWCRQWATGDLETTRRIGWAYRTFYKMLIEPYWNAVRTQFEQERSRRSRAFINNGCEGLLTDIGPAIRWCPPVLEADYPVDYDLHLNGTGLLLIPSFFCWRTPVTLADSTLRPVLVYPMPRRVAAGTAPTPGDPGHHGVPMDDPHRRALFRRIQGFIQQRLADPELDPATIAEAHHISLRTLHRMFESQGQTVAEHIRTLRLEHCRGDLTDPAFTDRPIHAVAARWGLSSHAHFTRLFRSAYGVSPQEYRILAKNAG